MLRRNFLKLMSFSPIAAKVAAEKVVADLSGVGLGLGASGMQDVASSGIPPTNTATSIQSLPWSDRVRRFLKLATLPEWIEEEVRDRARTVYTLDVDIAAKRSWSLAVKVQHQRARNFNRGMQDIKLRPQRNLRQTEFSEEHGVWI